MIKQSILVMSMLLSMSFQEKTNCDIALTSKHLSDDLKDNPELFSRVLNGGMDVIPCLIKGIDVNEFSRVGFYDATSSTFDEFLQKNYKGIKAAYLIEFLLRNNVQRDADVKHKLFGYGVIARVESGKPVRKPLTFEEIQTVRKIYERWWKVNRKKTLRELRNEHPDILAGSGFIWI